MRRVFHNNAFLLCMLQAAGLTACTIALGAAPEDRAAQTQDEREPEAAEIRDALLMLDGGPLHVRFLVTLNGASLTDAREEYIQRLIKTLDKDRDGKLTREEANHSPLLFVKQRKSAQNFLASLGTKQTLSLNKIRQSVERVGGEAVVYRQDESSANTDLEVFKFLDRDSSGMLDRSEIAAAADRILQRDRDRDECVSFNEFLPAPQNPGPIQFINQRDQQESPEAIRADLLRDTGEPGLGFRLLNKYDANGDQKLSAEELGWDETRIRLLDQNGDARLDDRELRNVRNTPVDLKIAVELTGSNDDKPALRVISTRGTGSDSADRPDFARIQFPDAVLTMSFRKVEPIAAAIETAMNRFNALDADANGYLDKDETSSMGRFERGLFDAVDFDGDGKIFGEEMKKYVTARGEPAASSCRVNLYDTGRGFFQTLDRNSDGRISVREIRTAHESLKSMQRDRSQGLSADEPIRHFHIEFVRGSYQLFGSTDQMISMAPRFEELEPVGPVWFQRMDRNNDGDLTWNEFLGPREVFLRLDDDRDNLIDPNEAEKAEEENP